MTKELHTTGGLAQAGRNSSDTACRIAPPLSSEFLRYPRLCKAGSPLLKTIFSHIISSAKVQLTGNSEVVQQNSKDLTFEKESVFDTVITSPPYPNIISYIRELRPLYVLG